MPICNNVFNTKTCVFNPAPVEQPEEAFISNNNGQRTKTCRTCREYQQKWKKKKKVCSDPRPKFPSEEDRVIYDGWLVEMAEKVRQHAQKNR